MPGFRLDQQTEIEVWDLGYTAAEAAGYLRCSTRNNEGKPLAATAFVAGFMGGAFLGKLPSWIKGAFEPAVLSSCGAVARLTRAHNGRAVSVPPLIPSTVTQDNRQERWEGIWEPLKGLQLYGPNI